LMLSLSVSRYYKLESEIQRVFLNILNISKNNKNIFGNSKSVPNSQLHRFPPASQLLPLVYLFCLDNINNGRVNHHFRVERKNVMWGNMLDISSSITL